MNNSRRIQQFAVFIVPQDRTPQFEERGLVFCGAFLLSRGIDQLSTGFLFRRIVRIAPAVAVIRPPNAGKKEHRADSAGLSGFVSVHYSPAMRLQRSFNASEK